MAKKSSIEKNNHRKRLVISFGKKRQELKQKIHDKNISIEERFATVMRLSKLPRNSSKVRVRNRCALTGRPRGYYGKFGLSRIALRDLASFGMLPGVIKASW